MNPINALDKDFRKILVQILSFFLFLFFLDFSIGIILRKFYFKQISGVLSRITYVLDKTDAPGLVLGSSRASHHYISDSLSASLQMPFYNAGKDGQSIFYHYAVLEGVLKRYTPKVLILDILYDELNFKQESYDRLAELLPYYEDHNEILPIISLRGDYEKYKLKSYIYPYNSLLFKIAIGNTSFNEKRFVETNGYLPLYGNYKKKESIENMKHVGTLDSNKIEVLERFIQTCKAQHISLFITISPHLNYLSENESIALTKKIAARYQVPFWDFRNDITFEKQSKYFWDEGHLNNNGAIIFTNKISTDILAQDSSKHVLSFGYN